jgi:alkylation response protein AidB-like acyl-CoA dehydrogenase
VAYDPLTDEQREIRDLVRTLARERVAPRAAEIDKKAEFPWDMVELFREHDLLGLPFEEQYGGTGTGALMVLVAVEELSKVCATTGLIMAVQELGSLGIKLAGTDEQKERFLPRLASGQALSGFALTEPCAGSDLTALRTTAELDGDAYVVNGEKLFITNVVPGRTIGLVCLIEDRPAVLIVDLPEAENENFRLRKYGLYALKHTHNQGIVFKNFRVPAENLLALPRGDGLTIAYHGLNRGRVALCANAAGTMRIMLASILPWAKFRRTYGEAIETRELVRRRVGRLAALIVGCDALTDWCAWLLDEGYRGEMECIIAKIFGSESQKEAAVELFMKTHGGRSFLKGHILGDNIYDFLAPCIYEGEGEMLGLAFFKSLVKEHGKMFFEPIGKALQRAQIKTFNPVNPSHAWALRKELGAYARWRLGQMFARSDRQQVPDSPRQEFTNQKSLIGQSCLRNNANIRVVGPEFLKH